MTRSEIEQAMKIAQHNLDNETFAYAIARQCKISAMRELDKEVQKHLDAMSTATDKIAELVKMREEAPQ